MNITVYDESYDWLFDVPLGHRQLWSLGRWEPKVEVGDDLVFRYDGRVIARSICRQVLRPGESDCMMHNGRRELKGWKVLWYRADLEDLRPLSAVAPKLCDPMTAPMREVLGHVDHDGRLYGDWPLSRVRPLIERGLISGTPQRVTAEGWRVCRREEDLARMDDIANGGDVCRICGCTDSSPCDDGCGWTDSTPAMCDRCDELLAEATTA